MAYLTLLALLTAGVLLAAHIPSVDGATLNILEAAEFKDLMKLKPAPTLSDHQFVYGWLLTNGYLVQEENERTVCATCALADCPDGCLKWLTDVISKPLIAYKEEHNFADVDGSLTGQVLRHITSNDVSSHGRTKRYAKLSSMSWDLNRTPVLTISFKSYLSKFSRRQQEDVAMQCARLWSAPSKLRFQLKKMGPQTNIAIDFVDLQRLRERGINRDTLGFADSPTYSSPGYSRLLLHRPANWQLSNGNSGPPLKWVMCHELGHNLNLDHSRNRNALMYEVVSNQNGLSDDDINGIRALYGRSNKRVVASRPSSKKKSTKKSAATNKRPAAKNKKKSNTQKNRSNKSKRRS